MKIKPFLIAIGLIAIASCSNNKPLFEVTVLDSEGSKVQFVPNMPFEIIKDSSYYFYSKEDYLKVMSADISKGNQIYKSDKFEMRVILRNYTKLDGNTFEFILRTFSNDFKIIDSYIMASTTKNLNCDGVINGNLEITTTCADGSTTTATVDEYGKFIVNE